MVKNRGQVAMEFLMTYGWAIIIILVAVGALWMLGVFSPSAPEGCTIDPPFSCKDVLIDEAGVSIRLALADGFSGSVSSVEVNGESCDELFGTGNIEGGEMINVRCVKPDLEKEEAVAIDFEAKSSKPGGFSKPVEGSATGEVKSVSPTQSLDPSMVAAYDFEDGAKDVSENNHDGTISGGVDCGVSGVLGSACEFDGVNSKINAGTFDIASNGQSTLSLWVYPKSITGSAQFQIVVKGGWGEGFHWWGDAPHNLFYRYGNKDVFTSGDIGIKLNEWNHIAVVRNGNSFKTYVNGVLKSDKTATPVNEGNSGDLVLGWGTISNKEDHGGFIGVLDELVIYNRALSPEEIQAHADI